MKPWLHWVVGTLALVGAATAACSSDESGGTGGQGGSSSSSTGSGTVISASTGATTSGATTSNGGGNECSMKATYQECDECECAKHQAGCDKYYVLEDEGCICGAGTPCETACGASYCTNGNPTATCVACWDTLTGEEP